MLLFSYLRSAITSIMAHAGLGSFIFPLINVHELAKKANLTIEEIVFQPSTAPAE
jgi:preprotein translocase subunit SecB